MNFFTVRMCAYALGRRRREPGVHQLDHLFDREAMRQPDRLGAAVAAGGQQFERAAAAGATDLYYAQAPAVLYHSRTLLQGDVGCRAKRWQAAR
jgi:hypothetical protein